jgi:hypothetical protein
MSCCNQNKEELKPKLYNFRKTINIAVKLKQRFGLKNIIMKIILTFNIKIKMRLQYWIGLLKKNTTCNTFKRIEI